MAVIEASGVRRVLPVAQTCRKLGVQTECHAREVVLLPHTEFYAA